MGFEAPSFDPLAALEAPARRAERPAPVSAERAPGAPDFGSGNVRFDEMLAASNLPLGEAKDFGRIFSVLPDRQKADVLDRWEQVLPKLLEATGTYEKQCAAIAEKYVRTMFEKANELYLRHQETLARSAAQRAELRAGTEAFDATRDAKAKSDQLAKMRALAAAPATPADDPLGALA